MKIALCVRRFVNNNISYNLDAILTTIDSLEPDTDLACFGEAFLQGFDCLSWDFDVDKGVGLGPTSPTIAKVRKRAIERRVAVAFGYIELQDESLYSSYLTISKKGETINNFRRVSIGWKEPHTDFHYKEGTAFPFFTIDDKSFTVALCGDLWYDDKVKQISEKNAEITLWPVYLDFSEEAWNLEEKALYARHAMCVGENVLLINSICDGDGKAKGGAAYFKNGLIECEALMGKESILYVEI